MANIDSVNWYISQFPEAQFLVPQKYKEEYNKRVIYGHNLASKANVLICGIARNVSRTLPYTMARIEALGKLFKNYHVFIYENDSTDNTSEILSDWSKNSHIDFTSEKLGAPTFHDLKGLTRRRCMAHARNQYLDYARQYANSTLIHYLIIVDMDLQGGWSYHGVLNSLGHPGWDIVGSNSLYYLSEENQIVRLFYDTWAFRSLGTKEEIEDSIANLFRFNRGEPLIQVNSCFGGLAIYKPYFLFEGVNYTEEDCDHPTLHNQLCNKGYKIYLNPSQITLFNKTEYTL